MGRNAQPIGILQANGRKHLTKAEIEKRKKSEIKVGNSNLKCPDYVKKDIAAYKKWKEILKIYKDVDFVSSGDAGLLSRYCMSFSEYENLILTREKIQVMDPITWDEQLQVYENFAEKATERQVESILSKLEFVASMDGLLTIEAAINKKMDMLIKMEDRLFLNPLAKVKNVPKETKEDDQPESKWSRFGGTSG